MKQKHLHNFSSSWIIAIYDNLLHPLAVHFDS